MHRLHRYVAHLTAHALIVLVRGLTAVRPEWLSPPRPGVRVYFANHASHADFVLLWAVLPAGLRSNTRPVAARDYWFKGSVRRFLAKSVFGSVLVDRVRTEDSADPIETMGAALDAGHSLILFPEGTRNTTDAKLLPLKSGLFRLLQARPQIECVPVWIENLNRVLPKGESIPVPLLCTVRFGSSIRIRTGESQAQFLERARDTLLELREGKVPGVVPVTS